MNLPPVPLMFAVGLLLVVVGIVAWLNWLTVRDSNRRIARMEADSARRIARMEAESAQWIARQERR